MHDGADTSTVFSRHLKNVDDLRAFMNHAIRQKVSDIFMQTGQRVRGSVYGRLAYLTRYSMNMDQINEVLRLITGGDEVRTALKARRAYDSAFSIEDETETDEHGSPRRHRFRLNATASYHIGVDGAQLVMRHIPSEPPTLEQVRFPEDLIPEIAVEQGAFLIAGSTGSGKSTTFAACGRHVLENRTPIQGNIITYEQPVEYLFTGLASDHCIIAQSEVGVHVSSFADGIRNAMRRKPALIVVGEMRDQETIQAAVEASNTGHPVWSTVHASNSSLIIQRMVQRYPTYAQHQAFTDIVQTSRFLMSQALVPAVGGGLACLRDYVLLSPERQEALIAAGYEHHAPLLRKWMREGQAARDMLTTIGDEWVAGTISEETRSQATKRYGGTQ